MENHPSQNQKRNSKYVVFSKHLLALERNLHKRHLRQGQETILLRFLNNSLDLATLAMKHK
jgi:hypothetical protein